MRPSEKILATPLKAVLEKPFSQLLSFGKVKGARFIHDCSVSKKKFLLGSRRSEKFEFDLFDFETVSYLCQQNGTKTHIVYFMNSCFIDQ